MTTNLIRSQVFEHNTGFEFPYWRMSYSKLKPLYSKVVRTIALIWYWKAKKFSLDETIDNKCLKTFRVNLTKV